MLCIHRKNMKTIELKCNINAKLVAHTALVEMRESSLLEGNLSEMFCLLALLINTEYVGRLNFSGSCSHSLQWLLT